MEDHEVVGRANAGLLSFSKQLITAEQYAIELVLSFWSFWGAWIFFHDPSNFAAFPGNFQFISALNPHENFWGSVLLVGGLLKIFGLNFCLAHRAHGIGLAFRIWGLAISGFFWPLMGASSCYNNPDTLTGVPIMIVGLSAWWTLLRFPRMPNGKR